MTVTDENGESKQVDAKKFFEKKKQRGRPVHLKEQKKIKMGLYVLPHQKDKFERLAIEFGLNSSQLIAHIIDELSVENLKKKFYLEPADRETKREVEHKVFENQFKADRMSRHRTDLSQEIQTSKGILVFSDIAEFYAYLEYCTSSGHRLSALDNTPLKDTLFWKNFKRDKILHSWDLFTVLIKEAGFRQEENERLLRIANRCARLLALECCIHEWEIWKIKDFHCESIIHIEADSETKEMKFPENNKLARLLISRLHNTEE